MFFDFLKDQGATDQEVARLNLRYKKLIEPFKGEIAGQKVIDLASHNGRWIAAFVGAGAAQVDGVEARAEYAQRFEMFPNNLRSNSSLAVGDVFEFLEQRAHAADTADIIAVFGIFYHIMDHYRLLKLCRCLQPKVIIIDSDFATAPWPHIALVREKTEHWSNSAPQYEGQEIAPIGIPSFKALEVMADTLDFDVEYIAWDDVPEKDRGPVFDYFGSGNKRRATATLRPKRRGSAD